MSVSPVTGTILIGVKVKRAEKGLGVLELR